jgi:hypothetical protein
MGKAGRWFRSFFVTDVAGAVPEDAEEAAAAIKIQSGIPIVPGM